MNVLLVDDQRAITENLKKNIHWDVIPVERVFTACSAKEAKMVLRNFPVDVLITDIEMPEEDGLALFKWARENLPDIEGLFLTSHADFEYARKAMHMGGFDYILQPVRPGDVEEALLKLFETIKNKKKMKQLESEWAKVQEQKNNILDGLLLKVKLDKKDAANRLYESFPDIFRMSPEHSLTYPILVHIVRWKSAGQIWEEKLLRLVFSNVMEELFEAAAGSVAVSSLSEERYWILLAVEKGRIDGSFYRHRIEEFYGFIEENMDFQIAVYPSYDPGGGDFIELYESLSRRAGQNRRRRGGVIWEDTEHTGEKAEAGDDAVELAKQYIAKSLNKNISRKSVAEQVHLNEEYFSRLFRQQTGLTFKDYVLTEKMNAAKKLLRDSKLSISIVASKVGYDNFSHFSKMFKKLTNQTPQEYRKGN